MKPTLYLSFACGLALALAGCGDDGGAANPVDAGQPGGDAAPPPANTFALTTQAFPAGGTIATDNTCHGANTSPVFTWSNPPAGTKSFAVVLEDTTIHRNHWVIYNIAPTATGLPAHIENTFQPASVAGAQQTISIHEVKDHPEQNTTGFYGPCPPPPPQGSQHDYVFTVYALDVATITGTDQTKADDQAPIVISHKIASASFAGVYTSPATPAP